MKKQSQAIQNDRKDKRASLISTLNIDEIQTKNTLKSKTQMPDQDKNKQCNSIFEEKSKSKSSLSLSRAEESTDRNNIVVLDDYKEYENKN